MDTLFKEISFNTVKSNNAITYHLCGSTKLSNIVIEKAKDSRNNLMFPIEFDGLKLSLWDNYPTIDAKIYIKRFLLGFGCPTYTMIFHHTSLTERS